MPTFPLIQLGLAVTVLAVMARWLDTARGATGCFFTFHRAAHNNVWEDLPNRNFYLDLDFLDNLIAHLKTSGRRIVTVEEGRRLAADPRMKEPFINFSIDDCYRDTYELVSSAVPQTWRTNHTFRNHWDTRQDIAALLGRTGRWAEDSGTSYHSTVEKSR